MKSEYKPKGFIKNVENIWYHYKFVILIALAALIMISFATYQSVTKKKPDIFIYHISTTLHNTMAKTAFTDNLELLCEDYNGDGKVVVDFKAESYVPIADHTNSHDMNSVQSFNTELAFGECVIFILDESFYLNNKDYMYSLEDALGFVPDIAFDEKAIKLSSLPAYHEYPGLQIFDENSYLCLIHKNRTGLNKISDASYKAHIDFLKKLIEI